MSDQSNTPETAVPERLLTAPELAALLGLQVQSLARWRCTREGPPYLKVGRAVRYRQADVDAWLARQTVSPAGGGPAEGGSCNA